jgi:cytochrome c oxidase subunit 2
MSMIIAIALIVLAVGSVLFFIFSPWYLTPLASNWGAIDRTITISFWVTGLVFLAVSLFLAVALIRFRYKPDRRSHYKPENKKLEGWLAGLTAVGIVALLAPGLFVWGNYVTVPDDAHEVEVVGQQWHWSYRLPGEDGSFGAVGSRLIDDDNPFGIDPEDPHGQDDVLVRSPRLMLPVDRPVKLMLRSKDVIHNFKVAPFRAKIDAVPGQTSYFWLTPTTKGQFEAVCAELCGIGHFAMRGRVDVVNQETFDDWRAQQPTFAELAGRQGDAEAGAERFATCVSCHGPRGGGRQQTDAPRLAGLDADYLARQLRNFRKGARGEAEADRFGQQMRPFATSLEDQHIENLAAYVETLPVEPTPTTIIGDVQRGERLYRTCGSCHGPDGEGMSAFKAPRLAGMNDWYLVRQLQHFRQGVRGRHPEDLYGNQMVDMAQMLVDDTAVRDVVAYINQLPGASTTDAERPEREE